MYLRKEADTLEDLSGYVLLQSPLWSTGPADGWNGNKGKAEDPEPEKGEYDLIGSYILDYECSNIPSPMRKKAIVDYIRHNIKGYVGSERADKLSQKAQEIMSTNVKEYDAYHVAAAIYAGC